MTDSFSFQRKEMVKTQLKERGITNSTILKAFSDVQREKFVRTDYVKHAYFDGPLPFWENQTISQPYIVALMTELLEPTSSDIICEIGTGSGYQGAILSKICKNVISFEKSLSLVKISRKNLENAEINMVEVVFGNGKENIVKKYGPYDKIIVTAQTSRIYKIWIDSLKEGGILVMPQIFEDGVFLMKYVKEKGDMVLQEKSIEVNFVPLV